MTANILTKGHIKCLEKLSSRGDVVIGLLTSKALHGYKKELVPYKERLYILQKIASNFDNIKIVPQNKLDPMSNIKKYRCIAIASGDGWEKSELETIKKLSLKQIDIKSGCKIHSSDIWKKKNK